jgi:D-alanyl-lipoteichoic acid acyltransferase DltB (MBOAT superfamily)
MAIGSALIFGLILPENFRRPYLATNLREFWRRWHITLSFFMRDYLYIPLGGNRNGVAIYVAATLTTMGLCGLWHGAGWTFIVWGLWHGAGLIVCHGWQSLERPLPAFVGWTFTMIFVIIGWVFFRAVSFASAGAILRSMTSFAWQVPAINTWGVVLIAVAAIASVALPSAHELKDRLVAPKPLAAAATAILTAICVVEVGTGAPAVFIYFQF